MRMKVKVRAKAGGAGRNRAPLELAHAGRPGQPAVAGLALEPPQEPLGISQRPTGGHRGKGKPRGELETTSSHPALFPSLASPSRRKALGGLELGWLKLWL